VSVEVHWRGLSLKKYATWREAAEAPQVGDTVDLSLVGGGLDDEVVATVVRRQWWKEGKAVICMVNQ
jgi:hypothetical protein